MQLAMALLYFFLEPRVFFEDVLVWTSEPALRFLKTVLSLLLVKGTFGGVLGLPLEVSASFPSALLLFGWFVSSSCCNPCNHVGKKSLWFYTLESPWHSSLFVHQFCYLFVPPRVNFGFFKWFSSSLTDPTLPLLNTNIRIHHFHRFSIMSSQNASLLMVRRSLSALPFSTFYSRLSSSPDMAGTLWSTARSTPC